MAFENLLNNPLFNIGAGILAENYGGRPTGSVIGKGIFSGLSGLQERRESQATLEQARRAMAEKERQRKAQEALQAQKSAFLETQSQPGMVSMGPPTPGGIMEQQPGQQTDQQRLYQFAALDPTTSLADIMKIQSLPFNQNVAKTKLGLEAAKLQSSGMTGMMKELAAQYGANTPEYFAAIAERNAKSGRDRTVQPTGDGSAIMTDYGSGEVTFINPAGYRKTVNFKSGQQAPGIAQQAQQAKQVEGARQMDDETDLPVWTQEDEAATGRNPFDVAARTEAIKKLPTETQKKYQINEDIVRKFPEIIDAVRNTPTAFGPSTDIAAWMPSSMQEGVLAKGTRAIQQQRRTPQEAQARAQVFKIASETIRDLAGQATTKAEENRITRFMPGEFDTPKAIEVKLKNALDEASKFLDFSSQNYGIDRYVKDVMQENEGWQEQPGGYRIRER